MPPGLSWEMETAAQSLSRCSDVLLPFRMRSCQKRVGTKAVPPTVQVLANEDPGIVGRFFFREVARGGFSVARSAFVASRRQHSQLARFMF